MEKQTCIISVMQCPDALKKPDFRRRRNAADKRFIVRFIIGLINAGYRHCIVCVDDRMSFRVAETLYFLNVSGSAPSLTYSLSLWNEASGRFGEWLHEERFFDDVLSHAKKLYWRHHNWYDNFYPIEKLDPYETPSLAPEARDARIALQKIDGGTPQKRTASMYLCEAERNGMSIKDLLAIYLDPGNYRELFRYAVKLTGNMDDAEDLLSDLIIAIYTKSEFLSAQEPLAYFKTCLRNSWINSEKRDAKIQFIDPEFIGALSKNTSEYHKELEDRETLGELQELLSSYAPDLVDAFIKFHLEDYSLQELASALGMKTNSLAKQFGRMREKIREKASYIWGLMMLSLIGRCAI